MMNHGGKKAKTGYSLLPGLLSGILCTVILSSGVALSAANYEVPSNKQASEVLPPKLRSGPHFNVQDQVAADGYMLRYTVNSDYGTFQVTGTYGLRKLIKEIQAIAAMKEMSRGEAFVEGVKGKAQETLEFGTNLVADPANTLASVPKGVAKLFDNIATGLQQPREPRRDPVRQQLLNVSDAKRKIAYDLGVDVYSSNRVLQNELDSLSKAQALGSLGVSAAIPYGGGAVAGISRMSATASQVNRLLRDESPSGLRNINEQKLQAMGVDQSLTERLLNHTQLSPRQKTVIVASLEKLHGAQGRGAFINFALRATDEDSANFMQNIAEILAAYQQSVAPLQEITAPGVVMARAANGTVLIPFPLDYGVWTVRAERAVKNTLAGYKMSSRNPANFELWVTGAVSPLARRQLEAQGIKVVENVEQRIGMMD
ncbi:hypothetical protein [Desulfobacca acetoxidans]|uniref:Uncharacterized protein n=1 Tax=Desulfobacca acetoxidans (strain ATCC 700848 / DSM 11109 / ASRB2) TaxID=880072 RepID=F2NFT2_DESAR|nr:hypothetical protein [Desulfobacca acetoxidans]AEB10201.1 hypothetical protein Desac_2380 [Desulfobacca acetoxidans DSM 11109]